MKKIPGCQLHVSKPTSWLESRFHFSFADYSNPANNNFGALRVLTTTSSKAALDLALTRTAMPKSSAT
eukprot:jgi/Tetstr1/456902/TSEL_043572.t1